MSTKKTLEDLANGFGVVTVMNACIYKLKPGYAYTGRRNCGHGGATGGALTADKFYCTGLYLDTLKIANLTMEGPTKTITGGQYANPLIKYGKTMTMEAQDALGRAAVMHEFFGCEVTAGRISVGDKFPGAFAIEGDTFFIDQESGDKVDVHIFIPQLLPDGIFNLVQDAEGDATVFDLNGSVSVTKIADAEGERDIFYEIRDTAFFADVDMDGEDNYHGSDSYEYKINMYKESQIAVVKNAAKAVGAEEPNVTTIENVEVSAETAEAYTTAKEAVDDAALALLKGLTEKE